MYKLSDTELHMHSDIYSLLIQIHYKEGCTMDAAKRKADEEFKDIKPQLPYKYNDIKDKLQAKLDKLYANGGQKEKELR